MTPDVDICMRCQLPDCDTENERCALRRTFKLVKSRKRNGMDVDREAAAAAAIFDRERWINRKADRLEARS